MHKTSRSGKARRDYIDYVLIGLLSLAIVASVVNILLTLRIAASLGISLGMLLGQ